MIAHGLQPLTTFISSNTPWRCLCLTCGNEGTPTYNDVNRGVSGGCWNCRNRKISDALRKDVAVAVRTMMDAGWMPIAPYPGAGRPWLAECRTCGSSYRKRLSHVQNGHVGCRKCLGMDYSDSEARAIMTDNGLIPEPAMTYPGSQLHWPSTCIDCGLPQTRITFSKVRQRGHMCKTCYDQRRGTTLRLAADQALTLLEASDWTPLVPYPGGTDERWPSVCNRCGTAGAPRLHNLRQGRRSCSTCAQRGIDYSKPGLVYLMHDSDWIKIGIATSSERISQHRRGGWLLLKRWDLATARRARDIEQAVLAMIRVAGYPHLEAERQLAQRGYSETAPVELLHWARQAVETLIRGVQPSPLAPVGPPRQLHPKAPRHVGAA